MDMFRGVLNGRTGATDEVVVAAGLEEEVVVDDTWAEAGRGLNLEVEMVGGQWKRGDDGTVMVTFEAVIRAS